MRVALQMPQHFVSYGETILALQYICVVTTVAISIFHYLNTPIANDKNTEMTPAPYLISILTKVAVIGYLSNPFSTLYVSLLGSMETAMLFERHLTSGKYV